MLRLLIIVALFASAFPLWAQEQDATDTPEEKLRKMRSLPGRMPQNVVTSFNRETVDSAEKPWSAIGRINIGGRAHCTGSLIGDKLVLTAAHCLYSRAEQRMVVPGIVHFLAGYSRGGYGGHSKVTRYHVPDEFDGAKGAHDDNLAYDWALVELEDPLGKDGNIVPIHQAMRPNAPRRDGPMIRSPFVLAAGYPGDRSHILSLEDKCRINAVRDRGRVVLTNCIAIKGDSGGPILQREEDSFVLIGLQTTSVNRNGKFASIGISALAFREALAKFEAAPAQPSE